VIREARRLKPDIPVIIITGFSTEASAIEAVNLGVSGYLTKPFRVPRVLAAAAKALGE
jgi:ActR/RegA family two-component response regulator